MDLPGVHISDFLIIVIPVGTGLRRLIAWLRRRRRPSPLPEGPPSGRKLPDAPSPCGDKRSARSPR
jgi:hypothetical protein